MSVSETKSRLRAMLLARLRWNIFEDFKFYALVTANNLLFHKVLFVKF